ncbi:MAG: hypothetical protein CMC92_01930 [Flavobacteriaceae bacterium]|nr:hypothetical protein [Flavobacteriaceae bacterium]
MKKKFLVLKILLIVSYFNTYSQSYLNIDWDSDKTIIFPSDNDLYGIFNNHYVEYFKSKFTEEVYVYETRHTKTKINRINNLLDNEIIISKINVSEIVDVRAKIINQDTIISYGFDEMKKMINSDDSDENYNNYKLPNLDEGDIVEIMYTVKKDFNFNGNKIIEESYPILLSKFILIENNFKSNIKIYNSNNSFVSDIIFDGKKSKQIIFNNLNATANEQYSTPIANKIKISYQCYENRDDVSQIEYWGNLVQNVSELFFPKTVNEKAEEILREIKNGYVKIPWNELKIANAIDEYIKNNFVISDEDDPKLNDIEYILNNKISNDFSIIQVYSSLFKEADIEYEVAISCNRYFLKFDPELFDPNQLREFLIFLPNQEKYISPNRVEYRVSEAPEDLLGNYGIFIDKDLDYYFSEITLFDQDFSQIKKNIEVNISRNLNKTKINESRLFSGYWAITNRNYIYLSENEKTDFLVDFFTVNGLDNKKVSNYNIKNFDISHNTYNTPLEITSTISTSDLIEEKEGLTYLKIGKVIGLQSNLFDEKERINPIEINFPNSYDYNIKVNIPRGYKIVDFSELNKSKEYISVDGNSTAKFLSKATVNGNVLNINIKEYYKELRYSKKRYQEFREVINAAAKFYESSVRIEKI